MHRYYERSFRLPSVSAQLHIQHYCFVHFKLPFAHNLISTKITFTVEAGHENDNNGSQVFD